MQAAGGNLGLAIRQLTAPDGSGQYDEEFAAALASQDPYLLLCLFSKLEKLGRDPFCAVMQSWQALLHEAILCRAKGTFSSADCQRLCQALTARKLLSAYRTIQSAIEACRGNIGIGHLCGALSVQLRREDGLLGRNR